jgi:PAS domain S-box-containing protein
MNDANKRNEERLNELAQLRRENAELKNLLRAPNPGSRLEEHRMLLDTIDTHVFYLSDPSTYGMVNKAHANFFGAQKSDLEYKNIYDILTAQEAEVCIEGNERIFRGKKQIVTEELMKGADGEERLFAFTKTPKLDADGQVEYVVCTGEDITDRKNAERLLTFTQFTINQAQTAIFWCHSDGRFFYVNMTACDWLMFSFDELKKMHIADINPEFPREAWEAHWQDIKTSGMVHMESVHRRKNGEIFPVELYSN